MILKKLIKSFVLFFFINLSLFFIHYAIAIPAGLEELLGHFFDEFEDIWLQLFIFCLISSIIPILLSIKLFNNKVMNVVLLLSMSIYYIAFFILFDFIEYISEDIYYFVF